jgi:hypothetical protein
MKSRGTFPPVLIEFVDARTLSVPGSTPPCRRRKQGNRHRGIRSFDKNKRERLLQLHTPLMMIAL